MKLWLLLGCLAFVKYFYLCPYCHMASVYLIDKPVVGTSIYASNFCFLNDTQPEQGSKAVCTKCNRRVVMEVQNFKELPL